MVESFHGLTPSQRSESVCNRRGGTLDLDHVTIDYTNSSVESPRDLGQVICGTT